MIEFDNNELTKFIIDAISTLQLNSKIKAFFSDSSIQQLIENNNFEQLYVEAHLQSLPKNLITAILLKSDINFLSHMTHFTYGMFDSLPIIKIDIPDNINGILDQCFIYCSKLKEVKLSPNIKILPSHCFEHCRNLEHFLIPENAKLDTLNIACLANLSIKSIKLPETIKSIHSYAFTNCASLKEIEFLGTKREWIKIAKGRGWKDNTQLKDIKCSDGIYLLP